jgi:hypothetical protein
VRARIVHASVCMCVHVKSDVSMYMYLDTCACVHMHVYVCIYVCMRVCMSLYMYVCTYVSTCTCICEYFCCALHLELYKRTTPSQTSLTSRYYSYTITYKLNHTKRLLTSTVISLCKTRCAAKHTCGQHRSKCVPQCRRAGSSVVVPSPNQRCSNVTQFEHW